MKVAWLSLGLAGAVAVAAAVAATAAVPTERDQGSFSTSLAGRSGSQKHNARLALDRLQHTRVKPGETFSFNKIVGTFSRDQGYRKAPVSYNGQLIDDWGGGVCQTSTTLYNAALLAGMKIEERHRHRFAPSYVPLGQDAAVAYWNVDLKFKNTLPYPVRIEGFIRNERLTIRLVGTGTPPEHPTVMNRIDDVRKPAEFHLGDPNGPRRIRNSGKAGADVAVYRLWPSGKRELISHDTYPVMARIVDVGR